MNGWKLEVCDSAAEAAAAAVVVVVVEQEEEEEECVAVSLGAYGFAAAWSPARNWFMASRARRIRTAISCREHSITERCVG
jgi:hypothetical protein